MRRPRTWNRQVANEYPKLCRTTTEQAMTAVITPMVSEKFPVVSRTSSVIVMGAPTIPAATAAMPASA